MVLGSAAASAPFLMKMTGIVPDAGAAEKEAVKQYTYTIGPGSPTCLRQAIMPWPWKAG